MPDLQLETVLPPAQEPPDEVVYAFLRRFLPDFYFVNAPISRMRRHFASIEQLPQQPVILDFHRAPGARFTELTLCAHDDAGPGLLSKIAGVLAALKIDVHTAWIHTLADPHQTKRRVVLDTFILAEQNFGRSRALTPKTQAQVAASLATILEDPIGAAPLLAKALRQARGPLPFTTLSASPSAGQLTLIKLSAADDDGVLFRVTRALAALQLDVAHAQINTFEHAVDDLFFISKADGGALSEAETASVVDQLRLALQSEIPLDES